MANVLLVDDEPDFVAAAREMLQLQGHSVGTARRLDDARRILGGDVPDVLLLDLMLPDGNGLELLEERCVTAVKRVVFITGHPGIKSLVKNLNGPSVSYLTKPIQSGDLIALLSEVADEPVESASHSREAGKRFDLLIGDSAPMRAVYDQIERVACTAAPVLVLGETGTGKELVAESIHRASGRQGSFVPVNCGSLSRELAGSELFGHEKGSFTGAVRRHSGFFKRADSGTLFLDELTEMPFELQPHFLRALESGAVLPVGSETEERLDARIVAATNREPRAAIGDKALREDLYYRLSVFPISLPPLRERLADVPLLVEHFLRDAATPNGIARAFSDADLERLQAYDWPGNVRELRHVVQRSVIMSDPDSEELTLADRFDGPGAHRDVGRGLAIGRSIRDVERELILRTLEHLKGDKKAAAETLGISLNTLYNRLNAYESKSGGL